MRGECATNLVGTWATSPHGLEETEPKKGRNEIPLVILNGRKKLLDLVFELVATEAQYDQLDHDANGQQGNKPLDAHVFMPKQ